MYTSNGGGCRGGGLDKHFTFVKMLFSEWRYKYCMHEQQQNLQDVENVPESISAHFCLITQSKLAFDYTESDKKYIIIL